jgi:hypothetical protein
MRRKVSRKQMKRSKRRMRGGMDGAAGAAATRRVSFGMKQHEDRTEAPLHDCSGEDKEYAKTSDYVGKMNRQNLYHYFHANPRVSPVVSGICSTENPFLIDGGYCCGKIPDPDENFKDKPPPTPLGDKEVLENEPHTHEERQEVQQAELWLQSTLANPHRGRTRTKWEIAAEEGPYSAKERRKVGMEGERPSRVQDKQEWEDEMKKGVAKPEPAPAPVQPSSPDTRKLEEQIRELLASSDFDPGAATTQLKSGALEEPEPAPAAPEPTPARKPSPAEEYKEGIQKIHAFHQGKVAGYLG